MAMLWVVTLYRPMGAYRPFGGAYCLLVLKMATTCSYETLLHTCECKRHHDPELQQRHRHWCERFGCHKENKETGRPEPYLQ